MLAADKQILKEKPLTAAVEPCIVWLDAPGALNLDLVGGKCRNLAALTAAGLPVPRGFAVSTRAYRDFLSTTGICADIQSALATVDLGQVEGTGSVAHRVQRLVSSHPLPAALLQEITHAYEALGDNRAPSVAVRSSATAEDLAEASFAGQHATFLGVTGADRIGQAVRDCWASLYSERAIAYRAKMGCQGETLAMGVCVQLLVSASVAGVMFTVNPATGSTSEIVVEASYGLGEAVVGGLVTPDRYVLEKRSGRTIEMRVGQKAVQIVAGPEGVVHQQVPPHRQGLPCLTFGHREQLASLARRVEEVFSAPQDIEWAIDTSGDCFLLQARPVTVAARSTSQQVPRPAPTLRYRGLYRGLMFGG